MTDLYKNPMQAGRDAFNDGKRIENNPISRRTHANAKCLWDLGYTAESTKCKGIEIEHGTFSGCNASGGDCPVCGK